MRLELGDAVVRHRRDAYAPCGKAIPSGCAAARGWRRRTNSIQRVHIEDDGDVVGEGEFFQGMLDVAGEG